MNVREAKAANVAAREVMKLAACGARIGPELRAALLGLLRGADTRLRAGLMPEQLAAALDRAERKEQV